MSASIPIFVLCGEGDEQGVRRLIAADRDVVHARDPSSVNYPLFEIGFCINIVSSMSMLILYHISIIYSTIALLCIKQQRRVIQLLLSSFYKQEQT
jgi:hypothetical protein